MCTEPALQTSKKENVKSTQTISPEETDKLYKNLEIELKGCDPAVLKSYSTFATSAAQHLGIELGKW
jgi:small subunit ribosomal protein S10